MLCTAGTGTGTYTSVHTSTDPPSTCAKYSNALCVVMCLIIFCAGVCAPALCFCLSGDESCLTHKRTHSHTHAMWMWVCNVRCTRTLHERRRRGTHKYCMALVISTSHPPSSPSNRTRHTAKWLDGDDGGSLAQQSNLIHCSPPPSGVVACDYD